VTFKDWVYKNILPFLGWAAVTLYSKTLRLQVLGKENADKMINSGKTVIFAVIHGRQFAVYRMLGYNDLCVMVSTSRDGMLAAGVLKKFGFEVAYGSSAKSPVRALLGMIKLMHTGYNGVMAVDGPKGPIYKVKPGILFLAKKMDAVIVPFVFSSKKAVIMKAWDKYMLPKPFAKSVVIFGEPFYTAASTSKDIIEKESLALEKILLDNIRKADKLAGWIEK